MLDKLISLCSIPQYKKHWKIKGFPYSEINKKNKRAMGINFMVLVQKEAISSNVEIVKEIKKNDFYILQRKRCCLYEKEFELLYQNESKESFYNTKKSDLVNSHVIVMIINIRTTKGIDKFKKLVGDQDPAQAEEGSLRKMFGIDRTKNGFYVSKNEETAKREIEVFFPELKF